MDRLAALLRHFDLSARVFHTGELCQSVRFGEEQGVGYVHVLRQGRMQVQAQGQERFEMQAPALLLYLRPMTHRLLPDGDIGTDLVCGSVDFGTGGENPLLGAVACPTVIPLNNQGRLQRTLELLFMEAFEEHCGRQEAMNRLCELLVIQLLRYLIDHGGAELGVLAGLADTRLARALNALHEQPAENWTLDSLARRAGMSRARFAVNFRETVGITPGEYLSRWRVGLAQSLLRKGRPVGLVADAVGYSSPAALSRAFRAHVGQSPSHWRKLTDAG